MAIFSITALGPESPLFRGRQAELDRLLRLCRDEVTAYVVLYGGRQNGKTSLLLRLEAALRADTAVCRLEFQLLKAASTERAFAFLAEQIARVVPHAPDWRTVRDGPTFQDFLSLALARPELGRLVLMLDELGALPATTREALANAMRSLFHARLVIPPLSKLQTLFSGGVELYDLVITEASSLHNICEEVYLSDLARPDAVALVSDGLRGLGLGEAEAIALGQAIYAYTRGHPYLTQRLGGLLERAVLDRIPTGPAALDWATGQVRQGDTLLRRIRDDLREYGLEDAARRLLSDPPPFTRLDDQLARLELIGLAKESGALWVPRNRLLAEVFRELLAVPATPRSAQGAPARAPATAAGSYAEGEAADADDQEALAPRLPPRPITFGEGAARAPGTPPDLHPHVAAWLNGPYRWPPLDWDASFLRPVIGLVDDPTQAALRPLWVELLRGHAVVFGATGWGKTTFLRSLAVSLAVSYFPSFVHIYVLDGGGRGLAPLAALPHVGTLISLEERGYEERVAQLFAELLALVDSRRQRFAAAGARSLIEYNRGGAATAEPAVVVLVDNLAEILEGFALGRETPDDLLEQFIGLARQGRPYGVHFVISAERPAALSDKIAGLFTERFALRLDYPDEYRAVVGDSPAWFEELPGRGLTRLAGRACVFQAALIPGALTADGQVSDEIRQIEGLGHMMQRVIAERGLRLIPPLRIAALPSSVLFKQLLAHMHGLELGPDFLAQLTALTRRRWAASLDPAHVDWPQVTIGVVAGDRPRTLSFAARHDGAHGIVAGGTGAGKSELLMTLIVGLALSYPPELLNVVLVDYKGGGAFAPFEELPHCVASLTQLDRSAVARLFTVLAAEIRRRQMLNAETGTKDIVEYGWKGLHQSHQPYPHLFVIIDEYAELLGDYPEHRQQLEGLLRVGRAQGVHVILASQQARGITDQMRANIKLRLCLRVEQIETSRELLRRPDAAYLPGNMPGRGYLQAGSDQVELIQVAYSGEVQPDDRPAAVRWPERPAPAAEAWDWGEQPRFYQIAIALTRELAGKASIARLWHPDLPPQISLEAPLAKLTSGQSFILCPAVSDWVNGDTDRLWPGVSWSSDALQATVGLFDDPERGDQGPLTLDLGRSHLAVFGTAGSGKSTLLRTVVTSLTATHHPDALQIYALDLAGRDLGPLAALPHVGAVIDSADDHFEERLQRLVEILLALVDERQRTLSASGSATLFAHNARYPAQAHPAILILIDGFDARREEHDAIVKSDLLPLARRSLGLGISFVVTSHSPSSLSAPLASLFGARLTFRQAEPERYLELVGPGAVELPGLPGRGYTQAEGRPLLFQAALPVGSFTADGASGRTPTPRPQGEALRTLAQSMHAHLGAQPGRLAPPYRIGILPEQLALEALLDVVGAPPPGDAQAVIGLNGSLMPVAVQLHAASPHFSILGPPLSGKTTALRAWILALAQRYSPAQVRMVLIDLQGRLFDYGGSEHLGQLPHVLTTVSDSEALVGLAERLEREAEALKAWDEARPQLFILVDNFEEFLEAVEGQRQTRRLTQVARSGGRYGLHFVVAGGLQLGSSDLRWNIMAANSGIGLGAAAVEALKVARAPTALRQVELPVGRGYLIKAGQAALLQVATPYPGAHVGDEPGTAARQIAAALDDWTARVRLRHPGQPARWLAADMPTVRGPSRQARADEQLRTLLQAVARHELAALRAGDGQPALVLERLLLPEVWGDPAALAALARETLAHWAPPKARANLSSSFATLGASELVGLLRAALQRREGGDDSPPR